MDIPAHEVVLERPAGSSAVALTFRSSHRLNPLTRGLVTDLLAAMRRLAADPPAVVTLRGGENFSCGAHTGQLAAMDEKELGSFIADELELCDVVAGLPSVTIAAIRGACIGNAAELALSCDLRIAREDATFAWPEVTLGYPAPVDRLAQFCGRGPATRLAVLGERISARRAQAIGLVTEVVEPGRFEERVAELAGRAAGLPRQAVRETKRRLDDVFGAPQPPASPLETEPPVPVLIGRWAAVQPGATFCVEVGGRSLTYAQFTAEARDWSRALATAGVGHADLVLTMLPTSCDSLAVWMGIAGLRAIDAAVNTEFSERMLEYVVSDTAARVAVVHADYVQRFAELRSLGALAQVIVVGESGTLPALGCQVVTAGEFIAAGDRALDPADPPQRHDVSCVIYTSGTTGPSKGVLVPWAQLAATIPAQWQTGAGTAETQYVPLPMYHVAGRSAAAVIARHGGTLVLRKGFSVDAFWADIREYRCTFTLIAGAMTNFLFRQPPRPGDADNPLAKIVIAPVIPEHRAFAERFGVEIVTGFNMTETSLPIYFPDGIPEWKACGRLRTGYPYYEVRIVDESDNEVPPGQVGELIVRTKAPWTLNAGYLGKPEATAAAWRNGWYHTGDAFRIDQHGHYFFVDRFKDAIRRRGENISSFEVEAIVHDHPAVAECAAIGVPSEVGEDEVQIFVVVKPGEQISPGQLIEFLRPRMPRFMLPRYVQFAAELPKTPATQRVRKHELRELADPAQRWDRESGGVLRRN